MNETLVKQVGFVVLQCWQAMAERDELQAKLIELEAKVKMLEEQNE